MEQGKRLEECLCVRRSIRQFTDQPVERTIIQTLLEMAILAPSASNRQPWRFIILDDPVLVQKIRAFSPGIGGNPPCLIVFCLDSQRLRNYRSCYGGGKHDAGSYKPWVGDLCNQIIPPANCEKDSGAAGTDLPGVYSNAWIPKVESTDAKTAVTGGNIFL